MPDAVGDCNGCVACCTRCGVPPFDSEEEIRRLPPELQEKLWAYWEKVGKGPPPSDAGHCLWLSRGTCSHYDLRPRVCREFKVGGAFCQWFKNGCVANLTDAIMED